MTQKELLYYEDAIGHEKSIIKICEEALKLLTDEDLVTFIDSELLKHKNNEKRLINLLEEKSNG